MKTLTQLFSKVFSTTKEVQKSEDEMSVDEYIASVQNRKQQFSNISCKVSNNTTKRVSQNDDLEASSNLVLA